jgi:hypothetical protein
MNFIEQIFGFSPDGGNGFTEACLLAAAVLVVGIIRARTRSRRSAVTRT